MTIMMSEALVGRLDTRSLIDKKDTAEEKAFVVDIFIDDERFSLKVDKFKKELSVVTVSFLSSASLTKKFMSNFKRISISLRLKNEELLTIDKNSSDIISLEVKLNSPEYYTELSIESD